MIIERKANQNTILCTCGHPLNHHQAGGGRCYKFTRRTEKRINDLGKRVKVKCIYECTCLKFEYAKSELNEGEKK